MQRFVIEVGQALKTRHNGKKGGAKVVLEAGALVRVGGCHPGTSCSHKIGSHCQDCCNSTGRVGEQHPASLSLYFMIACHELRLEGRSSRNVVSRCPPPGAWSRASAEGKSQ